MHKYALHSPINELEPWPLEGPGYRIVRGNPRASGRVDLEAGAGGRRLGIWRCTEGAFECVERGDELQTIISGRLVLSNAEGDAIECGPGDSIFTRQGERVTWDIRETVTKVFYTAGDA